MRGRTRGRLPPAVPRHTVRVPVTSLAASVLGIAPRLGTQHARRWLRLGMVPSARFPFGPPVARLLTPPAHAHTDLARRVHVPAMGKHRRRKHVRQVLLRTVMVPRYPLDAHAVAHVAAHATRAVSSGHRLASTHLQRQRSLRAGRNPLASPPVSLPVLPAFHACAIYRQLWVLASWEHLAPCQSQALHKRAEADRTAHQARSRSLIRTRHQRCKARAGW